MIWRRIAIATPLTILALSIVFAETYREPSNPGSRSSTQPLQLLGYNYNRQLVQLSVTLWNKGDKPVTIREVIYHDLKLTKGLIGSAIDHTILAKGAGYTPESVIPTNDLIFAAADHWNMDTVGPSSPIIQPNGIATLYLGVTSTNSGSKHLLQIVAVGEEYVFTIEFGGN